MSNKFSPSKIPTHPVGSVIEFPDGRMVKVVAIDVYAVPCAYCTFRDNLACQKTRGDELIKLVGWCSSYFRTDSTQVYFEEVKGGDNE